MKHVLPKLTLPHIPEEESEFKYCFNNEISNTLRVYMDKGNLPPSNLKGSLSFFILTIGVSVSSVDAVFSFLSSLSSFSSFSKLSLLSFSFVISFF